MSPNIGWILQQQIETLFLKNIQINLMKTKELKTSKSSKTYKRPSEGQRQQNRPRVLQQRNQEQYLSPMHIKIPKSKCKDKKQSKTCKYSIQQQQKATKRKQKKKPIQNRNGNTMFNGTIQLIQTIKQDKTSLKMKVKTMQKTFRNSSKNTTQQRCNQIDQTISPKMHKMSQSLKKNVCSSRIDAQIHQEQYLFIGNEFYLINNYCPTKRLLNTFREVCTQQNQQSKFILQDKIDKVGNQKLQLKKNNIFFAARKELQIKNKIQKAILLQRWWRKMIKKHNLHLQKSNPEIMVISNVSPIKNGYEEFDQINLTPIKPYLQQTTKMSKQFEVNPNNNQIEIVSFNSADLIEEKPKKIELKQDDLSKLLFKTYKLPQNGQIDHHENQAIFENYAKFKTIEIQCDSREQQDSSQNLLSPIKDDHYPQPQHPNVSDKDINFDLLKEFQQATRIKQLIDQRILLQKGQFKVPDRGQKIGINTSILSIHNGLVGFFNFYINKYRDQFLSLINMPYGHSIPSRIKALSGMPFPQEIEEDDSGILYGLSEVIDDQKLEEYFKLVEHRENRMTSSFSKASFQLQKIHFKAILDYFNQELNEYRPYRQTNGVPYPWNHSYKALTFYFVTEQNIAEVFQKSELKVLKASSLLCGIIVPQQLKIHQKNEVFHVDAFMQQYEKKQNGLILQHNDAREVKMIHQQVKAQVFQQDFQAFSGVLLQSANQLMSSLLFEAVQELLFLQERCIY